MVNEIASSVVHRGFGPDCVIFLIIKLCMKYLQNDRYESFFLFILMIEITYFYWNRIIMIDSDCEFEPNQRL